MAIKKATPKKPPNMVLFMVFIAFFDFDSISLLRF
jgi:hypothetical protein